MAKPREKKCEIQVMNSIAQVGLKRLPPERYAVVKESKDPQADRKSTRLNSSH